jgi:hypothetical protein
MPGSPCCATCSPARPSDLVSVGGASVPRSPVHQQRQRPPSRTADTGGIGHDRRKWCESVRNVGTSEMSLSHHSWRSPHDTAADDRRFGAETDRTRRISRRINDHAPVAAHRQLSTRSRSTPRLFDLPGTATTSISTVWMKFGVPRNAIGGTLGRTALVGAPSPARAGRRRPFDPGLARVDAARVVPASCGVAGLAELPDSVVALRAVPDLQARRFPTRPFRSGATRLAVVPFPSTATAQIARDRREWDMSCTHAVYVPHPLIKRLSTRPLRLIRGTVSTVTPRAVDRDHRQSRGHPAVTVSSTTGVPPSRGRPSAQPQDPVVLPTQPPRPREIVANGWTAREAGGVREAPRPESGTARQAGLP